LDRRLGGPQSRSGRGGEEKNLSPRWESTLEAQIQKKPNIKISNKSSENMTNPNTTVRMSMKIQNCIHK
jgi:hypothetical protein